MLTSHNRSLRRISLIPGTEGVDFYGSPGQEAQSMSGYSCNQRCMKNLSHSTQSLFVLGKYALRSLLSVPLSPADYSPSSSPLLLQESLSVMQLDLWPPKSTSLI